MSNTIPRIVHRATRRFVDDTVELVELLQEFLQRGALPLEFAFRWADGADSPPSREDVAVTVARCEMT